MQAERERTLITIEPNGFKVGTPRGGGAAPTARGPISVRRFFALTFLLGWGVAALGVIFSAQLEPIFGEMSMTNPIFILAVYSPGIAGVYLVWRHDGVDGLKRYLRRLTLWRLPGAWWLFLLLGIPAVKYLGAAFNGTATEFPFSPWYDVLPAFAVALFIGPVEEFGWRGVALPLLQRRLTPLGASLLLGAVWGLWHAPAFALSGTPQSAWSFGPYVVGVMALAVILTPIFNAARGSLLIPIIFHLQMNGPAWPDAQPWENWLFAAVAIAVVVFNWKAMTTRGGGATDVLLEEEDAGQQRQRAERPVRSTRAAA